MRIRNTPFSNPPWFRIITKSCIKIEQTTYQYIDIKLHNTTKISNNRTIDYNGWTMVEIHDTEKIKNHWINETEGKFWIRKWPERVGLDPRVQRWYHQSMILMKLQDLDDFAGSRQFHHRDRREDLRLTATDLRHLSLLSQSPILILSPCPPKNFYLTPII